jgi:hypothetical protein
MKMKSVFSAAMAAATLAASTAHGADIAVSSNMPAVTIEGDILPNDNDVFLSKVAALSGSYVVVLHSRGGNPLAAIEIGKFIRMHGWKTYVPVGCHSACALIWLAGVSRAMDPNAKIGVHAASLNGQEIGVGNALIGSYLTRLGYSDSVVAFATVAAPDDLALITPDVAKKLDIEVAMVPLDQQAPNRTVTPAPPRRYVSSEKQAENIVIYAMQAGNAGDINAVSNLYSDDVNYYGKRMSKSDIIADKLNFWERWPTRNYLIRPDSLAVKCDEVGLSIDCSVTGLVDWQAFNSSKRSSGSASFTYKLFAGSQMGMQITDETSTVITRTVTDLGQQPATQTAAAPQGYTSLKTWDTYLPSTKRYIRRELQVGLNAAYRLIATDHDAAGASNGGSTCNFNASGWSDCVGTAGNHYQLKPESIRSFLNIAAGREP